MVGKTVIECNSITIIFGKCLSDVCQIVFGLKQKDVSSLFSFNSASVYTIREALVKEEVLEFNANKFVVCFALIYSQHRTVLEVRIA